MEINFFIAELKLHYGMNWIDDVVRNETVMYFIECKIQITGYFLLPKKEIFERPRGEGGRHPLGISILKLLL